MPRKKALARELPAIPRELIEHIVKGPMSAAEAAEASMAFKKALFERILGAELSHHLGSPPGAAKPEQTNKRNGTTAKTVLPSQAESVRGKSVADVANTELAVASSAMWPNLSESPWPLTDATTFTYDARSFRRVKASLTRSSTGAEPSR